MKITIYADGASRGNPGPAAYGVALIDTHAKVIQQIGKTIGIATNNEAEYHGVLAALEMAKSRGATEVELRLDSKLLVEQLNGRYKLRAENLQPLYSAAIEKLAKFEKVKIRHVPRSQNRRADALANAALNRLG